MRKEMVESGINCQLIGLALSYSRRESYQNLFRPHPMRGLKVVSCEHLTQSDIDAVFEYNYCYK